MKKLFIIGLAVIFCFGLVVSCATAEKKNVNEKEVLTMANSKNPKKKWIKIRIDFETGDIDVKNGVKPHDQGGSEQELNQQEINDLLQGEHKFIGQLIHTHSSPGCVTYILGGRAMKICY